MSMLKVLVTGGAGFIGSNLVRELLDRGHEVQVLDDLSTGYRDNLAGLPVQLIEGSIEDLSTLEHAVKDMDCVVHLAALGSVPRSLENPTKTHSINASGTLRLLEAMRSEGIGHLIYASSSSVYGKNPVLPKSERDWVRPMSPYAVSKLAAEQYVLAYQESYGLRSVAFRFFNVYGPGQRAGHQYAAVIPIFLDAAANNRPLPINGSGRQSRDFTYVGTVTKVLAESIAHRMSVEEPVNLAFGTNTTILDLVENMRAMTGIDVKAVHRAPRAGDVPHSQADNRVLLSLFPEVSPVDLQVGLHNTWRWLQEHR